MKLNASLRLLALLLFVVAASAACTPDGQRPGSGGAPGSPTPAGIGSPDGGAGSASLGGVDFLLSTRPDVGGAVEISTGGGEPLAVGGWSGRYSPGTIVRLRAVPFDGYRFERWEGLPADAEDAAAPSQQLALESALSVTAVFAPGAADEFEPLVLSAYSGMPGDSITALGSGFEPNAAATLYWHGATTTLGTVATDPDCACGVMLGEGVADEDGEIEVAFTVPWQAGTVPVYLIQEAEELAALPARSLKATFHVESGPTLKVSPGAGLPTEAITATVEGFEPNVEVVVYLDPYYFTSEGVFTDANSVTTTVDEVGHGGSAELARFGTNDDGGGAATFYMPEFSYYGYHAIRATNGVVGLREGEMSAEAPFSLTVTLDSDTIYAGLGIAETGDRSAHPWAVLEGEIAPILETGSAEQEALVASIIEEVAPQGQFQVMALKSQLGAAMNNGVPSGTAAALDSSLDAELVAFEEHGRTGLRLTDNPTFYLDIPQWANGVEMTDFATGERFEYRYPAPSEKRFNRWGQEHFMVAGVWQVRFNGKDGKQRDFVWRISPEDSFQGVPSVTWLMERGKMFRGSLKQAMNIPAVREAAIQQQRKSVANALAQVLSYDEWRKIPANSQLTRDENAHQYHDWGTQAGGQYHVFWDCSKGKAGCGSAAQIYARARGEWPDGSSVGSYDWPSADKSVVYDRIEYAALLKAEQDAYNVYLAEARQKVRQEAARWGVTMTNDSNGAPMILESSLGKFSGAPDDVLARLYYTVPTATLNRAGINVTPAVYNSPGMSAQG